MSGDSNPIVDFFRSYIGKKLEGAPPLTAWLDGRIVSCNEGEIEVRFITRQEMANPAGMLHGGIQSAIMDDVIGMAAATVTRDGFMVTVNLNTNFIDKIAVGEAVIARARLIRVGQRISHAVCELRNQDGRLISRADSNLLKTVLSASN